VQTIGLRGIKTSPVPYPVIIFATINCHKNGKNPLLFQFIRKAIEWTVIIIEELADPTDVVLS
jgi:hypothetical protein